MIGFAEVNTCIPSGFWGNLRRGEDVIFSTPVTQTELPPQSTISAISRNQDVHLLEAIGAPIAHRYQLRPYGPYVDAPAKARSHEGDTIPFTPSFYALVGLTFTGRRRGTYPE